MNQIRRMMIWTYYVVFNGNKWDIFIAIAIGIILTILVVMLTLFLHKKNKEYL